MRKYGQVRKSLMAASLATALALFSAPASALALSKNDVQGCDYVFAAQESAEPGSVDILSVTGAKDETIYVDIRQGDQTIASHLAYTLGEDNSDVDANGAYVGIVSVKPKPTVSVSLEGARVNVYTDRAQTDNIFSGTISTVYAQFEGGGEEALATRTLGDDENRAFEAPTTYEHGGTVYELASDEPKTEGGRIIYSYKRSGDAPTSIDGHVSYYDAADPAGEPLKVDTVEGIKLGDEPTKVTIPSIISANGTSWRTLQLSGSVTLSYPGASEYAVQCVRLSEANWGGDVAALIYDANIKFVTPDGTELGADQVIVNKNYLYTPPTRLHKRGTDGAYVTYALSANNGSLNEDGALALAPGAAEGSATYEVVYEPLDDKAERTWTVVLVNGDKSVKDPRDPAREIARIDYTGVPGETVTHKTEAAIEVEVDGETKTFVPATTAQGSYDHTFGVAEKQVEQTIYYVPGDYVAPEAHEVVVNYVEYATGKVIDSETYTAAPTMRRDLEIETPETFSMDGVEYIRLNGQEQPISHSFFEGPKTYVVYYRDVNDTLSADVTITGVRVEYRDVEGNTIRRPVTVVDEGTTTATTTTTTTATTTEGADGAIGGAAAAAIATGIGTDTELVSIVDDETPLGLVTPEGTDLATVRIEDDETPMASGLEGRDADAKAAVGAIDPATVGVAAGVGLGVAAGIFLFFFVKRRKRSDDASSDDNATA